MYMDNRSSPSGRRRAGLWQAGEGGAAYMPVADLEEALVTILVMVSLLGT